MIYYIAEKNTETGRFELWTEDNEVHKIYVEKEALDKYTQCVRLHGSKDVLLLESVPLDIDVSVKLWKPER